MRLMTKCDFDQELYTQNYEKQQDTSKTGVLNKNDEYFVN